MQTILNATGAFQFKGSLFTLTVIQLLKADDQSLRAQLEQTLSHAPGFFKNTPLVIDLQNITENIDLSAIKTTLQDYDLVPVGVCNATEVQQNIALAAGLGAFASTTDKPHKNSEHSSGNKLITKPVRSGQQIYAPKGDLIITAGISPGAEIIADGNIHVYGSLQGRAMAGVSGDRNARIFCQDLAAELISIAGVYKVFEDIHVPHDARNVQVSLVDDRLRIDSI